MFRGIDGRDQLGLADKNVTANKVYSNVVILPHHPDRLRRPSPRSGAHDDHARNRHADVSRQLARDQRLTPARHSHFERWRRAHH